MSSASRWVGFGAVPGRCDRQVVHPGLARGKKQTARGLDVRVGAEECMVRARRGECLGNIAVGVIGWKRMFHLLIVVIFMNLVFAGSCYLAQGWRCCRRRLGWCLFLVFVCFLAPALVFALGLALAFGSHLAGAVFLALALARSLSLSLGLAFALALATRPCLRLALGGAVGRWQGCR